MKKILNIVSSVKGKDSFSIGLSNAIVEKLTSIYTGSSVHTLDLTQKPFPHLEGIHVTSFQTPEALRTDEHKAAITYSDQAIKEVLEADILVIGVPMYNFSIPSGLKAWIDSIVRMGVTFRYTENGPEGLIANKKVYLAISSGSVYSEGPMKAYDFTAPYLKAVLGFIGMNDITVFRAEGTGLPHLKDTALEKAIAQVKSYAFDAVAEQV
jgi:FMN-dependent NADH-azoreductase